MNGIIKLILTVVIIFITTVAYTIAVELSGHGLISSIVNTVGGMLIVYIWWIKKAKPTENNTEIKRPTVWTKPNLHIFLDFIRKNLTLIILLLLLSFLFFWFQLRPSKIRSYCNWSIRYGPDYNEGLNLENFELRYRSCLRSKGLEK